jgi:hypothetical protein
MQCRLGTVQLRIAPADGLRDAIVQALEQHFDICITGIPEAEEELPNINKFAMMLLRQRANEAQNRRKMMEEEQEKQDELDLW